MKFIVFHTQRILLCFHLACKESLSTLISSRSLLYFSMLLIFCLVVFSSSNILIMLHMQLYFKLLFLLQIPLQILNKFVLFLYDLFIFYFQIKESEQNVGHLCATLCCLLKHIGSSPTFIQFCFKSLHIP